LLGARDALAIDVDPIAAEVTRENAEANGVTDRVQARAGTIDDVEGTYDLVVANIQHVILMPMARSLIARVGRTLVLSGLLAEESSDIRAAYGALRFVRERRAGDWISLTFER
jgi:ribosomal protein L11 methyltransferase